MQKATAKCPLTPRQWAYVKHRQKKNKNSNIHFCVHKAPSNSFPLQFLSKESSTWEKMVVAREDFDGKLFINASSWHILKFINGTSAYHLSFKSYKW